MKLGYEKKGGKRFIGILAVVAIIVIGLAFVPIPNGKGKTGLIALFAGSDENYLYKSINAKLAKAIAVDENGTAEITEKVEKRDTQFAEILSDENSAGTMEAEFSSEIEENATVTGAMISISYGSSTQKAVAAAVGGPTQGNGNALVVQVAAIALGIVIVSIAVYFLAITPKG